MSDIIKEAIDAQARAFEEFKRVNDQKIEAVKSDKGVADLTAKLDTMFTTMQEQKRIIEELEAKAKRPNLAGGASEADENTRLHKEGFSTYMRKGKDSDLPFLEQKALGISTNGGADGGFAVPKVIDSMIEDLLINISPVRTLANVVQIGTSDYHKLVNLRGTASGWVGEADARGATGTPQLKDVVPPMGELYANPQATQQMLDDVFFNAESWLANEVATEFARAEGAAFIAGTGTNMPKGFTSYTTVATADSSRAFGSLQYVPTGVAGSFAASNPADILFNVVGTLKAGYRQGATWMMNKATLFQIAQFKDSTGRYIFNPVSAPGIPQQLLNYNLVEAEDMPGVGANALAIVFGDFKRGYEIVDRMGARVLRDPFSNKPYIGFYTTKRLGGGVINSEALKFVKFSAT